MNQRTKRAERRHLAPRVALALALCCLGGAAIAQAQDAAPEEVPAEQEVRLGISTPPTHDLVIRAVNQEDGTRAISIGLDGVAMGAFSTDNGLVLEALATYTIPQLQTYVVLRTNHSQGGCGGSDVLVLTVYPDGEEGPHVEISPILQQCLGSIAPAVGFRDELDRGVVVSVAGFEYWEATGEWVAQEESGAAPK